MKITIPIIELDLYIYIGKSGLEKFKKEVHKDNKDWEPDKRMSGYAAENYIWIHHYSRKTMLHELIHFLDWLYEFLGCEDESEFKAYLGEYVIKTVLKVFERK